MKLTTTKIRLAGLFVAIFWSTMSTAQVLASCESKESIDSRATDEICDYYVEASEDCFAKLNRRFEIFKMRSDKTPAKDLLNEGEPIQKGYSEAVDTVESYLTGMDRDACGDEREKIDVMIKALQEDLKIVESRIKEVRGK
ncbi:hypothetical protein GW916_06885 [bacterium]|nr:hypothetical protein [bacterium]